MRIRMILVGFCFLILGVGVVMGLEGGSDVRGGASTGAATSSVPATTRGAASQNVAQMLAEMDEYLVYDSKTGKLREFRKVDPKAPPTTGQREKIYEVGADGKVRTIEMVEVPMPATTQGDGRKVSFYGLEEKATKVVYVCYRGGAMLDNFEFLKQELKKSVGNLIPVQHFNVILFSDTSDVLGGEGKVVRAIGPAMKQVGKAIDEARTGGPSGELLLENYTKPFEQAMAMKPQVIFFLTNREVDPGLAEAIAKMNKAGEVRIHTIAFTGEGKEYQEQLKTIAKKNGGEFKFVSEKDLGR